MHKNTGRSERLSVSNLPAVIELKGRRQESKPRACAFVHDTNTSQALESDVFGVKEMEMNFVLVLSDFLSSCLSLFY